MNLGFQAMVYRVKALPRLRRLLRRALRSCPDVDVALASIADDAWSEAWASEREVERI